jgi:hypothetical protein
VKKDGHPCPELSRPASLRRWRIEQRMDYIDPDRVDNDFLLGWVFMTKPVINTGARYRCAFGGNPSVPFLPLLRFFLI